MNRRHLQDHQAWRAIGQLEAGRTQRSVADVFQVSKSAISRLWNRFQETGTVKQRQGQGRPLATTAREDRFVVQLARRNRSFNATKLRAEFAAGTGQLVSSQTVRNRLHSAGLYARRPMVVLPLTDHHKRARLAWANDHLHWGDFEWGRVLFTDESRFTLQPDNRRVRIWRERGTRRNPQFAVERPQYEGGGVMVWAGISTDGRTDLHFVRNGTLNAQRYRDEILEPTVLPYAAAMGEHFILMDDNARPHRANIINNWLEDVGIERMDWPANSPDGNPIEHAWDALGRRIADREIPPRTLPELTAALTEEWNRIPQEFINNLINSMHDRCQTFINVRGDHTHY